MRSKLFILVAALVLGALAAVFAVNYLSSARESIAEEGQPIDVLVAEQDLSPGASAQELKDKGLIQTVSVPRRYVAEGTVASVESLEGKVLASKVSKGEQLVAARFALPTEAGLSFAVPDDYIAVSIPVDVARGVGGLVRPGDSVCVLATFPKSEELDESTTKIILGKARVLAVDTEMTPEGGNGDGSDSPGVLAGGSRQAETGTAKTVTLAVAPKDAEKLVFAQEMGSTWLALLSPRATEPPSGAGQSLPAVLR